MQILVVIQCNSTKNNMKYDCYQQFFSPYILGCFNGETGNLLKLDHYFASDGIEMSQEEMAEATIELCRMAGYEPTNLYGN